MLFSLCWSGVQVCSNWYYQYCRSTITFWQLQSLIHTHKVQEMGVPHLPLHHCYNFQHYCHSSLTEFLYGHAGHRSGFICIHTIWELSCWVKNSFYSSTPASLLSSLESPWVFEICQCYTAGIVGSQLWHCITSTEHNHGVTRWSKYDRDKLWLVYTQIVPVIFEPHCTYEVQPKIWKCKHKPWIEAQKQCRDWLFVS
jgi:hypothetical protein